MAFALFTLTLAELQARYPRDAVLKTSTPAEFDAWFLECAQYIDEDAWGADHAKLGALSLCAHFAQVEDRAQSKAGRVGATASVTTETVSESLNIPSTGQTRDNIWQTTIYGQAFVRLRSTVLEGFIPLPDTTDEEGNPLRRDKTISGLSSWRQSVIGGWNNGV